MSCPFWTDKVGVLENCDDGGGAAAFAMPQVVWPSSGQTHFVLRIIPACGDCFDLEGDCEPVPLTSAEIVSGTCYDDGNCGCNVLCDGGLCGNGHHCALEYDTGTAVASWGVSSIPLVETTDPFSGEPALGIPIEALDNPVGGAPARYAVLTVNTSAGDGFIWIVGTSCCE